MDKPLANPRRTQIVDWPERLPTDSDAERPTDAEAAKGDLAAR